jgi:MerR family transcriptional regulator, light-induced transcriptional regulator
MSKYSIKELEKLSGIKAHTIRIWEKRYNVIEPARTQTNIRFYSDDDLKKIINVAVLNNNGVKISKIVKLNEEQINQQVAELSESKGDADIYIERLILTMIDMDEAGFENLLGALSLKFGFERAMLEVIYPFLEKIGILWLTNKITPAQEHFISYLIRQKIIVAIDSLPPAPLTQKKVVLFLPENELHEIGLIFYHYITKKLGFRTFCLGQNVPYTSLLSVCETHKPDILITALYTGKPSELLKFIGQLSEDLPLTKVLLSGYAVIKAAIKPEKNILPFTNILMLKDFLQQNMIV